jgi:zinc protease
MEVDADRTIVERSIKVAVEAIDPFCALRPFRHPEKLAGSPRARARRIRLGYSRRALNQNTTQEPAKNPDPNPVLHRVLPNGLTMLLRESHRSPVVELQIWAGVGSADERPGEEGLAHFHEHMLFKGTERRGVGVVAGDIEGLGGHINAYTSFDETVYHATLPSAAWREGLDVLTDAVRFSIFDEAEIAREREVVLEEIRRSEDTPGHVLGELAFRECYKAHPYGLPILGPASNVAGFDRTQVREFFERWYTPDNLLVVATGDFDAAEVSEEVERLFGDAAAGQATRSRAAEPLQKGMRVTVLRKPFEGHRVDLSWPASNFRSRDSTHLDLLAYVLGECESSRLIRQVREREALVDRIDASAYTPLDRGLFSIGFETDDKRLLDATRRIVEETDRLRHVRVSEAELERARVNFLASDQFDRESVSGVASKLGSFESMGGGWEREAEALETLRTATPDDLLRVAKQYLLPEALTVAALIPESTDDQLDEEAIRRAVSQGLEAAAITRTEVAGEERAQPSSTPSTDPTPQRLRFSPMRTAADGAGERLDATLRNGLDLHILRRPEVPVVAVRLAGLGGLLSEDERNSGLTRFLAAMWTRGTTRHDAAAFARKIEGFAANVDGFSGRNSIGLTLDCLSETLEPAFELFADAILEPRFDNDEIERERRESLAALERREDQLGQRAFQLFARTEFETHPYRMTVLGEAESVSALTRDDLIAHSQRLIHPERAAISVVGDVDPEVIARLVERRFQSMAPGSGGFERPAEEPRAPGIRESELIKDRAQAHLVIGFRGVALGDPDCYALELIAQILAGQGGRLFLDLRDRQSLAYTVSASNVEGLAPGYFTLYIATAPEKLDRARAGILEEIERLVRVAPSPEELQHAIRFGTGSFAINSQRSHGRAAHIALDSVYGLGADHTESYPAAIAKITPEDVLRVAQRIFRLDAYSVCTVHP